MQDKNNAPIFNGGEGAESTQELEYPDFHSHEEI